MNTQSGPGPIVASAIFGALASLDVNCAKAFQRQYPNVVDDTIEQQIVRANRFWRQQLGLVNESTISVRECLMDDCDLQTWIRHFAGGVAPEIVRLGLPKEDAQVLA